MEISNDFWENEEFQVTTIDTSWFGTQLHNGLAFVLFVNKMEGLLFLRSIELNIGNLTGAYYMSAVSNRSLDDKEEPMISAYAHQHS